MSQKVTTRKGAIGEEKEKRQTDSPAKDVKKKTANAEKDKQTTSEKPEKSDKQQEKVPEKPVEKDKKDQKDKKETEKKDSPQEKKEDSKTEKSGKPDKPDGKPKENGNDVRNGTETPSNGGQDANGTVSDTDDEALVIDDDEPQDELFPELAYDDSDIEGFEPPTPENLPSRSFTRRSQVKASRSPETPRPASDKQTAADGADHPKDSKVLKLKDDTLASDRKLRSADSPKPQDKKPQEEPPKESEGEDQKAAEDQKAEKPQNLEEKTQKVEEQKKIEEAKEVNEESSGDRADKLEVEVVVEIEADDEPRKVDTNYSKSRVKVSPYRRSMRLADQTTSSVLANYTGNNTTMEMDITESSFVTAAEEEPALDDSSYLRGLRSIRGRTSYKPLKEITLRHVTAARTNRSALPAAAAAAESRPTAPVVGRKRKPEPERDSPPHSDKRLRLLDRIAAPFRRGPVGLVTLPRRTPEIVGINTDLPLTAPVASPDTFDPESLKAPPPEPVATPLPRDERDGKRCVLM
ncbi:myb-like protein X isoform X2 [Bombyx mandarina]|uniref:Myb-like protein X isoform X2 n=1 Tax=Bombyx mandarina TaxID=7092 RepID=A0A6J2JGI7_BOMMA|nr:myb-like protein X isoform X2 [Bombyx mandarina]